MCHSVKLIKIAGTSGLSNLHGASNSQSQRIRCHSKLSARVVASKITTNVNTGAGTITELMRHSFLSSQHKILQSQSMYESDKVSRNYRSYYPFRSNNYPGRSFIWKMVKSDFNQKLVKRVHWSSVQNWSKLHTLKIKWDPPWEPIYISLTEQEWWCYILSK